MCVLRLRERFSQQQQLVDLLDIDGYKVVVQDLDVLFPLKQLNGMKNANRNHDLKRDL